MLNANNSEFPSSDISYYQLQAGIGVDYGFNSGWTERATQAFFGRLNYDYKGRYLAHCEISVQMPPLNLVKIINGDIFRLSLLLGKWIERVFSIALILM